MQNIYKRHRFPPSIIQYAVWLYYRFNLSIRDVEDLLAERNINVSYESIRLWVNKFGPEFAHRLKRKHQGFGDIYFSVSSNVFLNQAAYPERSSPINCVVMAWYIDPASTAIPRNSRRGLQSIQSAQTFVRQKIFQAIPASIFRGLGCGCSTISE